MTVRPEWSTGCGHGGERNSWRKGTKKPRPFKGRGFFPMQ